MESTDTPATTHETDGMFRVEIESFETPLKRIEDGMRAGIPYDFNKSDEITEQIGVIAEPLYSQSATEGLTDLLRELDGHEDLADFATHLYNIQTSALALHMSLIRLQRNAPTYRYRIEQLVSQLPYIIDSNQEHEDSFMTHLFAFKNAIIQADRAKAAQAHRRVETLGVHHRQAVQEGIRELGHVNIYRDGIAVNTRQLAEGYNMKQFIREYAQMWPKIATLERSHQLSSGSARLVKDIHDACLVFSQSGKKQIDNRLYMLRNLDQDVVNHVYLLDSHLFFNLPHYMRQTLAKRFTMQPPPARQNKRRGRINSK